VVFLRGSTITSIISESAFWKSGSDAGPFATRSTVIKRNVVAVATVV
jgi:hypothetical protein